MNNFSAFGIVLVSKARFPTTNTRMTNEGWITETSLEAHSDISFPILCSSTQQGCLDINIYAKFPLPAKIQEEGVFLFVLLGKKKQNNVLPS